MMPVRQDFRENLGLAFDTIRTHKLRSFLAVLGVLIGVALIILVVGLVQGFRTSISEEIASEGLDTAWVARFTQGPGLNGRRPKEERERKPLTFADAQAVMTQCPAVKQTAISVFEWTQPHTVRYQSNQVAGGEFRGTFPAYLEVYSNANIKAGRFFTETENDHRENVVVLGENIATALFGKVDAALDKQVLVDGVNFRVIGVLEKPVGLFGTSDEDRRVVMPYYTFFKIYPASFELAMRILAYPGKLDLAVDQVRDVLRRRRNVPYDKPDSFAIQTNVEMVKQFNDIIGGVVLVIVVLSSIGLLIGGMGVMNIMLVSVTERTREIGVRVAVGATEQAIRLQFLGESIMLSLVGGAMGVLFGIFGSYLVGQTLHWPIQMSVEAVVVAAMFSIAVGVFFGYYPARKASLLDPIEALRYE
jgi:putative ABC transport system permease protein